MDANTYNFRTGVLWVGLPDRTFNNKNQGALPMISELAIGGTAVGTGINTSRNFG